MEKRLFLAVFLSLGVVFVFQTFFSPKKVVSANIDNSIITSNLNTPVNINNVASLSIDERDNAKSKEELFPVNVGKYNFNVSNHGGNIQTIHLAEENYTFPIKNVASVSEFDNLDFEMSRVDNNSFELLHKSNEWNIKKQYHVLDNKITINYNIQKIGQFSKSFKISAKIFDIDLSSLDVSVSKTDWTLFECAIKTNSNIIHKEHASSFNQKWNKSETKDIEWLAFRDRYFATVVAGQTNFSGYETKTINDKLLQVNVDSNDLTINSNEIFKFNFTVYAGPQLLANLKETKPGFEKVLTFSSWGWLDAIAKAIYWMLGFLHKIIPVWGLCIILVSLIVYGLMYPLTLKSMTSMKKMQSVQPKMAELKLKYAKNPEKMNQEVVKLYKEHNVNPVSGCLPMLLQMPIFIGLYQVLWRSYYFRGEGFLWMKDLSLPDRLFHLPFEIPFLGNYINILPILMIFIMMAQQKISLSNMAGGDPDQVSQQKVMALVMPIMLGVIFYNFSSGLNMYFVVFYSLSAFSQWHISAKFNQAK